MWLFFGQYHQWYVSLNVGQCYFPIEVRWILLGQREWCLPGDVKCDFLWFVSPGCLLANIDQFSFGQCWLVISWTAKFSWPTLTGLFFWLMPTGVFIGINGGYLFGWHFWNYILQLKVRKMIPLQLFFMD